MIYSLQFLRGIAAGLVILWHFLNEYNMPSYGEVGVDIFFIISGFIMVYVTQKDTEFFFLKRIVRIVPLYWLGTLSFFVLSLFLPSLLNNPATDLSNLFYSLFFIPYKTSETWFPILKLGWTLNYEMFFYLLFFIGLKLNHKYRAEITAILILSLTAYKELSQVSRESIISFYGDSVIIEFIYGMALAKIYIYLTSEQNGKSYPNFMIYSFAALFILLFALLTYHEAPFHRVVSLGIPSTLLIAAILILESKIRLSKLLKDVSIFLGNISYAAYLGHFYIIAILSRVFQMEYGITTILCVYISVAFAAYMAFILIENPARQFMRNNLKIKSSPIKQTV